MKIVLTIITLLIAFCDVTGVVAQDLIFPSQKFIYETGHAQYKYKLAKAIARCEGYYAGNTLAWRNKNPGNLKAYPPYDKLGHSIYKTRVEGWLDLYRVITTKYAGMTPKQMNDTYATDPNWHVCVSRYL